MPAPAIRTAPPRDAEPRQGQGARTIVALSGGVDSSVALMLLKRRGVDVQAVFMKNWDEDDAAGECPAARDLADARIVCDRLDVPLRTVNLSAEYWEEVFLSLVDGYRRGFTPNPDVLCNRAIKFRAFTDYAADLGGECVATGHYARVDARDGRLRLLRGRDPDKDQTYFLHLLSQDQLARALFPIGDLPKQAVRRLAREAGLSVHDKKDSTGVCFVEPRRFSAFLKRYIEPCPGPIVSLEGRTLGEHDGLAFYTIGQRQGLGVGGVEEGDGRPWYVVDKEPDRNALVVVQGADHEALHARALVAGPLHWIAGAPPADGFRCTARIRHRQADQPCELRRTGDATWQARFDVPQRAVAPGQSLVLYAGEACLGGGPILRGSGGGENGHEYRAS